jgi:hypothetical protein
VDASPGRLCRSAGALLLPFSPPASLQPGEVLLELAIDPLLLKEFALRPPDLVRDRGALPLRRERNGPRSGKSQAEAGEHGQVGVSPPPPARKPSRFASVASSGSRSKIRFPWLTR